MCLIPHSHHWEYYFIECTFTQLVYEYLNIFEKNNVEFNQQLCIHCTEIQQQQKMWIFRCFIFYPYIQDNSWLISKIFIVFIQFVFTFFQYPFCSLRLWHCINNFKYIPKIIFIIRFLKSVTLLVLTFNVLNLLDISIILLHYLKKTK